MLSVCHRTKHSTRCILSSGVLPQLRSFRRSLHPKRHNRDRDGLIPIERDIVTGKCIQLEISGFIERRCAMGTACSVDGRSCSRRSLGVCISAWTLFCIGSQGSEFVCLLLGACDFYSTRSFHPADRRDQLYSCPLSLKHAYINIVTRRPES